MLKLALVPFILAVLAATSALAQPAPEFPRPEDGYFQETLKIAPGVWSFVEPRFQVQPIGNVTLIEQSDGLVLVDSGGSPGSARRIVAEIRRFSAKPVNAVIITHWHGDHPQGLSEILKAWPKARTIATRATQAHLKDRRTMNTPAAFDPAADETFYRRGQSFIAYSRRMAEQASDPAEKVGWAAAGRLFTQYAEDMRGAVTISTTEAFDERLDLPDARTPIEVRFLGRANTDGDAIVWLPKQKVLISGDIVVAPFPFGFGSYPADWLRTLDRIRAYDFEVLVPGHGRPQRDRAYLDRLSGAIAEVRAKVASLVAQGVSLEDARKRLDFTDQTRAFVGDDPWLRRWFSEYWSTPFLASAYKEAKGEPIVQTLGSE
ncbi:MBL fold metallo-hydrolase [Phenylobacterium sp.]|uniref:MBL fold metallo-hydrolase n=1 Tax=Phenylobacterium sp. TaxID=1871053 RepID=UPI002ED78FF2